MNEFKNFLLEKLPSNTYRLSYTQNGKPKEIFYSTKAQLLKVVNNPKTYSEIKDFIREHLMTGTVIK